MLFIMSSHESLSGVDWLAMGAYLLANSLIYAYLFKRTMILPGGYIEFSGSDSTNGRLRLVYFLVSVCTAVFCVTHMYSVWIQ